MSFTQGFVCAATGHDVYRQLAIRSAKSLRAQCPEALIDFYTDVPVDTDVFNEVHLIPDSWFRPKIDALIHSRFHQTVYIDTDTFVIDAERRPDCGKKQCRYSAMTAGLGIRFSKKPVLKKTCRLCAN